MPLKKPIMPALTTSVVQAARPNKIRARLLRAPLRVERTMDDADLLRMTIPRVIWREECCNSILSSGQRLPARAKMVSRRLRRSVPGGDYGVVRAPHHREQCGGLLRPEAGRAHIDLMVGGFVRQRNDQVGIDGLVVEPDGLGRTGTRAVVVIIDEHEIGSGRVVWDLHAELLA